MSAGEIHQLQDTCSGTNKKKWSLSFSTMLVKYLIMLNDDASMSVQQYKN